MKGIAILIFCATLTAGFVWTTVNPTPNASVLAKIHAGRTATGLAASSR